MIAFVLVPTIIYASDGTSEVVKVDFTNFGLLALSIPLVVEFLKQVLKPPKGFWTQLISWVTGLVITMIGWWLGLGFLTDLIWWQALVAGLLVSLASNGVWDIGIYEAILKAIGIKK